MTTVIRSRFDHQCDDFWLVQNGLRPARRHSAQIGPLNEIDQDVKHGFGRH